MKRPRRQLGIAADRRKPTACAHCLAAEYKIAKLEPKEGDVLVLRVPADHTKFELEQLAAQMQQLAPHVTSVLISGDIDPAIARRLNLDEVTDRGW